MRPPPYEILLSRQEVKPAADVDHILDFGTPRNFDLLLEFKSGFFHLLAGVVETRCRLAASASRRHLDREMPTVRQFDVSNFVRIIFELHHLFPGHRPGRLRNAREARAREACQDEQACDRHRLLHGRDLPRADVHERTTCYDGKAQMMGVSASVVNCGRWSTSSASRCR